MAYTPEEGENEETIGIFEIKKGRKGKFIRRFNRKANAHLYEIHSKGFSIRNSINSIASDWIEVFVENMDNFYDFVPNIVLEERFFELLDKSCNSNMKNASDGETVTLHYPSDEVDIFEVCNLVKSIASKPSDTQLVEELQKRGITHCKRTWKVPYQYVAKRKDAHCMHFEHFEDEETMKIENKRRFIEQLDSICKEIIGRFGKKSEKIFQLNDYTFLFNNKLSCFRCIIKNQSAFNITFSIEDTDEFHIRDKEFFQERTPQETSRYSMLYDIEFSWYVFWKRYCISSFQNYLNAAVHAEVKDALCESLSGNRIISKCK